MKKSQSFFALLIFCLSFVLIPATDIAAMWDVPVAPGESFRWVFVTSGARDATSSDISVYNQFVNDAADTAGTSITGVVGKSTIAEIDWKAIASTPTTNAIDNIGGYSPAGIYTPIGDLVANGTTDMFDGFLVSPINITETGDPALAGVFTGTNPDGYSNAHYALGGTQYLVSLYGLTNYTTPYWIYAYTFPKGDTHPLYAISEELVVVPVPSALMLAATGLFPTLGLMRWRRKH